MAERADREMQSLGRARQVLRASRRDEDLERIQRRPFHLEVLSSLSIKHVATGKHESRVILRLQPQGRQAREIAIMLKEIDDIARGMLFLHGHVVRSADVAGRERSTSAPRRGPRIRRSRAARWLAACVCGFAGTPARLVTGQIR
jgi:hypothetical protein